MLSWASAKLELNERCTKFIIRLVMPHNSEIYEDMIKDLDAEHIDYLYTLIIENDTFPLPIPDYYPQAVKKTITKINHINPQSYENFKLFLAGVNYALQKFLLPITEVQQNNNLVIASQTVNLFNNTSSGQPILNLSCNPDLLLSLAEGGYLSPDFMKRIVQIAIEYFGSYPKQGRDFKKDYPEN